MGRRDLKSRLLVCRLHFSTIRIVFISKAQSSTCSGCIDLARHGYPKSENGGNESMLHLPFCVEIEVEV